MQTNLADFIKNTPEGSEAEAILRACVHCGFCLATCPTYQLLGDELDSPRGRIYLMKQMLEGEPVTQKTQMHLDRCLTCRACETVCPSGVRYGRLVDISRGIVEKRVGRGVVTGAIRFVLRQVLPNPGVFASLLKLGQWVRPLLPGRLKHSVPPKSEAMGIWPAARHTRKMLVLDGCVQPALAPNINAATARVLDQLGISLLRAEQAGCCGAVSYHLNAQQEGLDFMRRNVDAWWPYIEKQGIEAIVMTASGCGVTVKEYGHLLSHDPAYAEKAVRISTLTKDISEVLTAEADKISVLLSNSKFKIQNSVLSRVEGSEPCPDETTSHSTRLSKDDSQVAGYEQGRRIAFHSPCTLQHGQKILGLAEKILLAMGCELSVVPDAHLCCGSAGTYSILQPQLSQQLLKNKVAALESGSPAQIVTANIGCLMHLQSGTSLPVRHWIEVLDERLSI